MALVVLARRVPRGQIPPARELELSVARRQLVGDVEILESRDEFWESLEGWPAVRVDLDRELALKLFGRARSGSVAQIDPTIGTHCKLTMKNMLYLL